MKPKIKETDLAMFLNNETMNDYLTRLKLIAVSLFKWEGLEEIGGNADFLEDELFTYGKAVFVNDKNLGFLTLHVNDNGLRNVYNEPTLVTATGVNYNRVYKMSDVVYIKNNPLMIPTKNTVELMAYRLYEIQRTIDINVQAQKTPSLIEGDTKDILTLKNIYMQFTGNMPVLYGRKDFNIREKLNVLNTEAPIVFDKLEIEKHEVWNECLTYLGIDNANTDKKERLITDEVESNNELIEYYLNCFFEERKKACKKINKLFFNDEEKIKVSVNKNIENLIKKSINDTINAGDTNE